MIGTERVEAGNLKPLPIIEAWWNDLFSRLWEIRYDSATIQERPVT